LIVKFVEIIEHWTGWCPKCQRVQMASKIDFLSEETYMKTQNSMKSRTKGIAAIILVLVAALAGMRLEFDSMQSLSWFMSDSEAVEGYQWLANNTEKDATVLAWWDYADGIEKIGQRRPVVNEASKGIANTIAGYQDPKKPWHKIEYALWYPFESDEKVRDVAGFFISENATSAKKVAQKYGANYALVMSEDLGKYFAVVMAAGKNIRDYINVPTNRSSGISDIRPYLKKENVFTRMVNGDNIEGFSKAFDNGRIRVYKLI
jgi:asparagine N-glycosylation enzyme membrane subunit Stt3